MVDRLTHVQALSLSSDGPIADAAWRAAQARDRADAAARGVGQAPIVARVTPTPAVIRRRMAQVIRAAGVARGCVMVKDFERDGIDEATARTHFTEALLIARLTEPAIDGAILEEAA